METDNLLNIIFAINSQDNEDNEDIYKKCSKEIEITKKCLEKQLTIQENDKINNQTKCNEVIEKLLKCQSIKVSKSK